MKKTKETRGRPALPKTWAKYMKDLRRRNFTMREISNIMNVSLGCVYKYIK